MNLHSTIEIYAGGPGSGCRGDNCGRKPDSVYHGTSWKRADKIVKSGAGLMTSSSLGLRPTARMTPDEDTNYAFSTDDYELARNWGDGVAGATKDHGHAIVTLRMSPDSWKRTELDPDFYEGKKLEMPTPGKKPFRTFGGIPRGDIQKIEYYEGEANSKNRPVKVWEPRNGFSKV